jgi:hypothetical protein
MGNANKPVGSMRAYRGPFVLLIVGTIVPLAISIAYVMRGLKVPQCPLGVTQAQIDSGSCIIGANMSGVYIVFAIPFVLLAIVSAAIWALAIRKRRHKTIR